MLLTVQRQWDCDLGLYKIKLISFDCKMGWCFQIKDFWAQVTPDEVPVYFSCLRERCTNILLWSSRNAFWTQEASLGFPSTWVESDGIFLFFFFFQWIYSLRINPGGMTSSQHPKLVYTHLKGHFPDPTHQFRAYVCESGMWGCLCVIRIPGCNPDGFYITRARY